MVPACLRFVTDSTVKRFASRRNYIQWKGLGAIPLWDDGRQKIETIFFLAESKYLS